MTDISTILRDGIDPNMAALRAWLANLDSRVVTAALGGAGISSVADIAARDAFFAIEANQDKLVYVNNNNGADDDPANGIYEYVDGAPRPAAALTAAFSAAFQALVDEATAAADAVPTSSALNRWSDAFFRDLRDANPSDDGANFLRLNGDVIVASSEADGLTWDDTASIFGNPSVVASSAVADFYCYHADRTFPAGATMTPSVGVIVPSGTTFTAELIIRAGYAGSLVAANAEVAIVGNDEYQLVNLAPLANAENGAALSIRFSRTVGSGSIKICALQAVAGSLARPIAEDVATRYQAMAAQRLEAPELVTPAAIYGIEGRECCVYFDNLLPCDAADYAIDVAAADPLSTQLNERWAWTPAAALGAGNLTITVNRKVDGAPLVSKSIAQRAAAAAAGLGETKTVMAIGDSLVNSGLITGRLLANAASDVMGVELVGTRGESTNKHEGRGGYTINDYSTAGRTYYDFTVSGVVDAPALNAAQYTHNGTTYRVQEVNLVDGDGTIRCDVAVTGPAPLASGTLTKSNGAAGDATIEFSASATASGNPFWIEGVVDFPQYLADNGIAVPDWVFVQLGTNDVFSASSDAAAVALAASELAKLDVLIASIKAAGANVKVALALIPPPAADQDSFGFNYGTGQPRWRVKRNYALWSREMIAKYSGEEASRIYLAPSYVAVDSVNGFPRNYPTLVNPDIAVAATFATIAAMQADLSADHGALVRVTNGASAAAAADAFFVKVGASGAGLWREAVDADGVVRRQNNSVHPSSGCGQIGEVWWAVLKYFASA
ncbi:MAG: SGNH/GDSL hydrolase family protein [Sphingomonas sp.]